jgi:glycosyltransferase involved in cell wall biosynthesis
LKLSIIIPARNEKQTVAELLRRVRAVDVGMEKEIIVVDGSNDETREILERERGDGTVVIFEEKPRGKGAAIRRGLSIAQGDVILFQDADLELDPSQYPELLAPVQSGEAEVVYGSRFAQGRGKTRLMSYAGNWVVTAATNLLFGGRLTDVATCYKVFRRRAVEGIKLECNGFDLDIEITAKLLKAGHRIVEVPVRYEPRTNAEGKKLRWRSGFGVLTALVRCRFKS